ncbi:MAG: RagB/SusD family nutrient uptake outer membrane protein [Prevotella sp.]|nr:RagB/SusD family nutrient uptake outer membrane protein [Prevotella sp.]
MMKKYLYIAAAGLLSITGLTSCSLDEYNPSAGSATITNYDTWKGLQVNCYSTLYHELYSKSDFLFISECGTDLWLNPASKEYSRELFYYRGLGVERQEPRKTWQQAYSVIATCNTVINKADEVEGGDPAVINLLAAEAKCLRAFFHLTLATYFGPIPLCTNEVGFVDVAPHRNSLAEVYASVVTDLQEAAAVLNVEPYQGNYGRVCKKTALGLLARAYAQGAAEGLTEGNKSYWQRAKEVSEDMINNSAAYGMYLYDDVSDLWAVANNRGNKEALFTAAGLDATGVDANMAGTYLNASSYLYGYTRTNPNILSDLYKTQISSNSYLGNHNQDGIMAPTKHAIEVFGDWDKRYENTFLTAYGLFTIKDNAVLTPAYQTFTVGASTCLKYGINTKFANTKIRPYVQLAKSQQPGGEQTYAVGVYEKGDATNTKIIPTKNPLVVDMPLAVDEDRILIYLSKNDMTPEDKAERGYFCMNISDLFDADGNYSEELYKPGALNTNANQLFPTLVKYNWLFDGATRHLSSDGYDFRNGDVYIMRAAEIYLIAAEANVMTGTPAAAVPYLQKLHDRACRPGYTTPAIGTPTEQDILDEYAREFCGEHMRWPVLKRHRANGLMKNALQKYNKKAYENFNENIHYLRPIPKLFLDQIENAQEFGDNGYGYTASKGY